MREHLHFRLRGGAWIIRQAQSDMGWKWPWIERTAFETHIVFEIFRRRIMITFWKQKQLTDEEIDRERRIYELKQMMCRD